MAAFNWVEVEVVCPACRAPSVVRCQVHFASSYASDEIGRFHHRTYRLDQKMAWWQKDDDEFEDWKADWSLHLGENDGDADECCYSTCLRCRASLFVVLRYENFAPVGIISIGREENWPRDFLQ